MIQMKSIIKIIALGLVILFSILSIFLFFTALFPKHINDGEKEEGYEISILVFQNNCYSDSTIDVIDTLYIKKEDINKK